MKGLVTPLIGSLTAAIDRRELLHKTAGIGAITASMGVGSALNVGDALADAAGYYRKTSRLNLRRGASTSKSIILVIPNNAMVTSLNKTKNGFSYVAYQGSKGWAHADFLIDTDGGSSDYPDPISTIHTTNSVNFRWQPSLSSSVIQVLPAGTEVDAFDVWENGFRMVGSANIAGWVHGDYLGGSAGLLGGYVVTTSPLSLREEPSSSARILAVTPKGAKMFLGDVIASDFISVSYNGTSGWAHKDFLKTV